MTTTEFLIAHPLFQLDQVIANRNSNHNMVLHFMVHFGPAIVGADRWKNNIGAKVFSEIMSPSDEMFLLVTIANNENKWRFMVKNEVRK